MGTYLSTPVLDKCEEEGKCLGDATTPVAWGVVDMQGWRKSMEDAHVAQTDVRPPPRGDPPDDDDGDPADNPGSCSSSSSAKVFAVFDGHGGPEVARFCQLYLVDVLTTREEWEKADVGKALVESFHAIDRMVDDPARRDELTKLRSEKPKPGERKTLARGAAIPDKGGPPAPALVAETGAEESAEKKEGGEADETDQGTGGEESDLKDVEMNDAKEENGVEEGGTEKPAAATEVSPGGAGTADSDQKQENESKEGGNDKVEERKDDDKVDDKEGGTSEDDKDDEDSDVAVGDEAEIAAPMEGSEEESDDADEDGEEGIISTADAMALFQKLLTMSGASGKVSVEVDSGEEKDTDEAGEESAAVENAASSGDADSDLSSTQPAETAVKMGPDASQPTRIQNGRQVCNLPDHPIHAGCTSVVAVLVERTLTVANAGDSRAVLCRAGGATEALSFDHKPLQDREMKRITEAGGFVNQFGRVNGNLNLSRSIGDMKYKQVPGIPPSGQMITAEPDIVQVTLNEGDEFIVLGCDGIWDCLTNEEAVKYVRDRIDTKTPVEIGREMLDEIVSDDPRASQGIGGDNMTVMVIDLLPQTRSYHK